MLIFNFTNDLFNQIFNGDQPVHAAKFINHQRHMAAAQPHLMQQVKQANGRRDIKHRPQQAGELRAGAGNQMRVHILDMKHAQNMIPIAAMHRHPAMICGADLLHHRIKPLCKVNRDNICTRDHHIFSRDITQTQHIFQQGFFMIIKI